MRPLTEKDLAERLTVLAGPVPPSPPALTAGIRRRAAKQRLRRTSMPAVAVLVLVVIGSVGWLSRPANTLYQSPAGTVIRQEPTGVLLGWPTRGALAASLTASEVASAWDTTGTTHRQVHLLYAGRVATSTLVVAEGRDQAGRGHMVALVTRPSTGSSSTLYPTADVPSPVLLGTSYLVIEAEHLDRSTPGALIALAAPTADHATLRAGEIQAPLDPSTGVATAVTASDNGYLVWSLVRANSPSRTVIQMAQQTSGSTATSQPLRVRFFR